MSKAHMIHEQNNSSARASHFTLFSTFLSSPLHDYHVKLPNPTEFYGGCKNTTKNIPFFFNMDTVQTSPQAFNSWKKFFYIWVRLSKDDWLLKNENSFFYADVFTALVIVVKGLSWLVFVYLSESLFISLRVHRQLSIRFSVRNPFSPHPES